MRNHIYLLVAVKIGLIVWGVLGFIEYFNPSASFGLQDSNFPRGTQYLHWFLLVLSGTIFVFGFFRRWKHTPYATITMYATLATLCFIETVDFNAFGGGSKRFFIMAAEYVLYCALSVYLIRSKRVNEHFGNG